MSAVVTGCYPAISACQGWGREFESRFPLQILRLHWNNLGKCSRGFFAL